MIADRFILQDRADAVACPRPFLFTPALVGFYFSFRTAIVLIVARAFLLEPQVGAAAALALNLLLLIVVAFQCAGTAAQPLRSLARVSTVRWVFVYLAFAACSFAWTGAVSVPSSFLYWCGLVADVLTVLLMLRTAPVEAVAHSVLKGFIASTCVLATVAWLMPAQADLRLGDPDYFNTNQIGNLCAFAVLLAQYLVSRKDGRWGFAATFLTLTLVRSLSKTTLVAFFLSEGLLLLRDNSMRRRTKVLIVVAVLAAGLWFWGLYESYYGVYTTAGNQAETFTGRTAIWAYALNAAVAKPWIGNGFDALWKVMPPFGSDQFEARHAENELLQQFFAYGVVGVALLIALYGSLYRKIRRLTSGSTRLVLITLLLFIVIRGLAEAEPFDLLLPLWAITLLSALFASDADPITAHSQAGPRPVQPSRLQSLGSGAL
jgi:O-antigen ligase